MRWIFAARASATPRWMDESKEKSDKQEIQVLMAELRQNAKDFKEAIREAGIEQQMQCGQWFAVPTQKEMAAKCEQESSLIQQLEKQGLVKLWREAEPVTISSML